jgi:hypothetical protein
MTQKSDGESDSKPEESLNVPSGIKAQLATVESALVLKIVGRLSSAGSSTLNSHLRRWLRL